VRFTATKDDPCGCVWLSGNSDGDVASADAGPLPRCTCTSYGPNTPIRVPKGPGQKSARRSRWQQGGHWMQWGRRACPRPAASTKSTPGLSEAPLRCLLLCAVESAHSDKRPSPSLRSARVLTGLYSAFANPVLERLGYGMANMRRIWRDGVR